MQVEKYTLQNTTKGALVVLEEPDGLSSEQTLQLEMAEERKFKIFKVRALDEVFEEENVWRLGCLVREWVEADFADPRAVTLNLCASPIAEKQQHFEDSL